MLHLGVPELLILLVIIIILFGVGRIGKVAGELGSAINNFREAVKSDNDKSANPPSA